MPTERFAVLPKHNGAPGQTNPQSRPWAGARQAVEGRRFFFQAARESVWVHLFFSAAVPLAALLTTEWIARGTLAANRQGSGFWQAVGRQFPSFLLAYILLVTLYVIVSQLSGRHALATALVGLVGNVPALVTFYKLTMRGEPFLPWDIFQIEDLLGVSDNLRFVIPANVWVTLGIFALLTVAAAFVRMPRGRAGRRDYLPRFIAAGTAFVCLLGLLFGVFLSPAGTAAIGIREDMWMQDRYYRTNGVISAFLTNLQMLSIRQPEGYSEEAVRAIADDLAAQGPQSPLFTGSYAAAGNALLTQPDIIYLMAESFWDVGRLPGIAYNQPLTPNLTALAREGAYGTAYTPSFGGGTCDVEFEVLTGFSMEHLPAGSKPYQQYVTGDIFALPQYLKSTGYQTLAVHGYGGRFWNRDVAYPRLGIDTFIASEDFVNPQRRRGFISDDAMVDEIIGQLEGRQNGAPMFVHAVTMQNHTTYSRERYPAEELVRVTDAPASIPDSTIGQLEDCATGIREMDAALGKLVQYLRTAQRPAILVFWGDHMNPMSDGYALFEKTGYIDAGDTASPKLRETPLLMWSNFDAGAVALGTLAAYNITPVMLDLYGLEKPVMFDYLARQLAQMRGRTRGVTVGPDSAYSETLTAEQEKIFNAHGILQYDYLFGEHLLEDYVP